MISNAKRLGVEMKRALFIISAPEAARQLKAISDELALIEEKRKAANVDIEIRGLINDNSNLFGSNKLPVTGSIIEESDLANTAAAKLFKKLTDGAGITRDLSEETEEAGKQAEFFTSAVAGLSGEIEKINQKYSENIQLLRAQTKQEKAATTARLQTKRNRGIEEDLAKSVTQADILDAKITRIREKYEKEIVKFSAQLIDTEGKKPSSIKLAEEQIKLLEEQRNLEIQQIESQKILNRERTRYLTLLQTGTEKQGFFEGIREEVRNLPSEFQRGLDEAKKAAKQIDDLILNEGTIRAQQEQLRANAVAARRIFAANQAKESRKPKVDLAQAINEVESFYGEILLLEAEFQDKSNSLQRTAFDFGVDYRIRELAIERLALLTEERDLNLLIIEAKKLQAIEEERLARLRLEGSFEQGAKEAAAAYLREIPTAFEAGFALAEHSIQEFNRTISGTISDAIFSDDDNKTLKDRFRDLFKSIGKFALQLATQQIIGKLFGNFFGLKTGGEVNAAARGGIVPQSHKRARGYAGGSSIVSGIRAGLSPAKPPKGVPKSDTTPIWATPGEYVIRLSSVRKYGADIMESINRGLIDPDALKEISKRSRVRPIRSVRNRGFATGGEIASNSSASQATQTGSNQINNNIVRAYMVSDEQEFDRLLSGNAGKSFIKFIGDNKDQINQELD